ncbi:hypothetical protein E2C01_089420 [Portunus trituberculatus]|uniref:Uncharacterized protein n=1 Tax=Portunus trituberculatus TaxID=210409 RepID=A0A5B7JMC3_PORTR|nr:hypothetical protein [Portunus trituberculatus]
MTAHFTEAAFIGAERIVLLRKFTIARAARTQDTRHDRGRKYGKETIEICLTE